jgi:hypothetical protein
MSDWFDSPGDLAAIAAVVAGIFGVLLYVIKAETSKIARELKPNHGGSLHDVVTENGKRIDLVVDNQGDILNRIEDLHKTNDATHEVLSDMVKRVSGRLDEHAGSPNHGRRLTDKE